MHPRKASLFIIFAAVFIDLLGFGMVLPLLPLYADEFAVQLGVERHSTEMGLLIGLLMSSFSAMQFVFAPLWGRLSDRVGRRPVLLVGLAGSAFFYSLFGMATLWRSVAWLFVARIGAGIAGATISTAHAYIADVTTKENRAKGMALVGAAFGLGFTFGPLLAYFALSGDDATAGPGPGFAAGALSFAAFLLAFFKLPESLQAGEPSHARERPGFKALGEALTIPSIGLLLLTSFLCVFAFANFESTMSLTLKDAAGPHAFSFREVLLVFAFIGLVLTIVQGGIVRRLAGKLSEGTMATSGAALQIAGFILLAWPRAERSSALLLTALAIIVSGFAFITPSLNALISRRSDPARQGRILGLAQGASALARILGPMAGLPLYENAALARQLDVAFGSLPFWLAAGLMLLSILFLQAAVRTGRDFSA